MTWVQTLAVVLHVLLAAGIIGLVLLQHGKGADMGAAFGSGSSGSLFGATGSANFLSRTTAVLRLRKFAEPLEPNRLPAEPLPKAAPMSAPLPCWSSTRPQTTTATTRCITSRNDSR